MGLSIGNQIYKGGATYLDDIDGCVGYYNYYSSTETTSLLGVDIKSVHEIVKPGYYRISLGNLRNKLSNTFSNVMKDTKLPDDSRVLIYIPDGYLIPASDNIEGFIVLELGLLNYLEVCVSSNADASKLADIYSTLSMVSSMANIPYIAPSRLKKCVFKSTTKKSGTIDSTWTLDDVNGIYDIEIAEKDSGVTHPIKFYLPSNKPITVYIEGYGFRIDSSPNIIFSGEPSPDKSIINYTPKIFESFVYEGISMQYNSVTTDVSLYAWGYNLPFVTPTSASQGTAPFRVAFIDKYPYSVGTGNSDLSAVFNLPYNPNVFFMLGELPANKLAYVPLTFDMNNMGAKSKCSISSIGRSDTPSYLPTGKYLFDTANSAKFNYSNLGYSGYLYLYSIEATSVGDGNATLQRVYESYSGRVLFIRIGGIYGSSSPWSWKTWTYFNC